MAQPSGKFICLSIITLGVYTLYSLIRHQDKFNSAVGKDAISQNLMLSLVLAWGGCDLIISLAQVAEIMSSTRAGLSMAESLYSISAILGWTVSIILIVMAFNAKAALEDKFNVKLNAFWTFLFNFLYINHFLNKPVEISVAAKNKSSNADELEKYASMFERGVLTQEEFDFKKKEILES